MEDFRQVAKDKNKNGSLDGNRLCVTLGYICMETANLCSKFL